MSKYIFTKRRSRLIVLILLICQAGSTAVAQQQDAGLWMSVNTEKKISRALSVTLSEEFRLSENMSVPGTIFTDAGLTLRIGKNFRLAGSYRFIAKMRDDHSYSKRHRYYFDLVWRERIKPLTFLLRTRFQSQYQDIYSSSDGRIPEYYSRNKLTIKYDLRRRVAPYFSTEFFTPLTGVNALSVDNFRYMLGAEYTFSRVHAIDLFYMIQHETGVKNPETDFVLGLGYYFTF